jgi:8-oxo-dGTP diphosphatase
MIADTVRAAGGVVWRLTPAGAEVVLVHRPSYDDWTFPKGKVAPGETDEEAAQREVLEETGFACRLGLELPTTTYVDLKGRPKTVRYWAMTVMLGARAWASALGTAVPEPPGPHDPEEVDSVSWELVPGARRKLTYARDVVVLDGFQQIVLAALGSNVGGEKVDNVLEGKPQGN